MGVSLKQFAEMKSRLGGRSSSQSDSPLGDDVSHYQTGDLVLGIDPSLRGTGWGVVRVAQPEPVHIRSGTIHCPAAWERTRCLGEIGRIIACLMVEFRPVACVCEGLFFAQNLQTALIMGEARGAALAAVAVSGISIHEISARKVKQAIVGYGAAQKMAVALMVQRRLSLDVLPTPDAADALALAIVVVQESRRSLLRSARRI